MGGRSTAPLVLNFGTNWRWVVNFTVRLLYPLKRSSVPTGGWVGPKVGLDVLENRRHFASTGIRSPDSPARSAVSIPAMPLREIMMYGCGSTWWFERPTLAGNLAMPRQFHSWGLEDLTFQSLLDRWCTNRFNIQQLYVLPILYLCVLYLSENKQRLRHLQHKLIGFYNRDEKCLLRGRYWVFK
jgi:hypothetical protein